MLHRLLAELAGAGVTHAAMEASSHGLDQRRLDGVLQVRESKLVLLHAPRAAVEGIARLLPSGQRPTITPIEGSPDDVALQALCHGAVTWQHLEDMKRAGASSLLVLPVEKMLA